MLWCLQGTLGVVHALQVTAGVLLERKMTSVFMHVRQLWLAPPINRTMSKHSQQTTREEQHKSREKTSLAQEKSHHHRVFSCKRNSQAICESVPYKLRDIL
jgi:hypothetical protein